MTKFSDGPAAGKVLHLGRAPLFLRVVQNAAGEIDALDKLDDKPEPDETITVYRKISDDGSVHFCGTKNGKRWGAFYKCATYGLHKNQPDDATARNTAAWRGWVSVEVGNEAKEGCPSEAVPVVRPSADPEAPPDV